MILTNILIRDIYYGVIEGFPALRKALTAHEKTKRYFFSRVFDIANQLLTPHSPFAPDSQVVE